MKRTSNVNILEMTPLISPGELKRKIPAGEDSNNLVYTTRNAINDIILGRDKRMLVLAGPCSIHDPEAAFEYAQRLRQLQKRVADKLLLVMRVYFEKPRTRIGWRGLIVDPEMNGSYNIALGLARARKLLSDITSLGVPVGSEMLDPIVPQYISDFISWAAIGARTTESQTHREMASGLSMPVGFKNSTDGSFDAAVNGIASSMHPRTFIGIDQEGRTALVKTRGNSVCHLILRGGKSGPNYHIEKREEAEDAMKEIGLTPSIMVDCSHSNSSKDYSKQSRVLRSVIHQRSQGSESLIGFMVESNLKEGKQKISLPVENLVYGRSVTDACIGWEETEELLQYAYDNLEIPAAVPSRK
ncbi:MAG: 3-deoxy-7-phosphoheptulonate synthase [Spirochaetia bacterium]